jgi:hypothetical protein
MFLLLNYTSSYIRILVIVACFSDYFLKRQLNARHYWPSCLLLCFLCISTLTFTPMQKASVGRYECHTGSEQNMCVHIWLTYSTGRLFWSVLSFSCRFFLLLVSGTAFLCSSLVKVISMYNTSIMVLRDIKSGHALVEGKTNIVGRWICKHQSLWRVLSSVIDCHRPVKVNGVKKEHIASVFSV